jgi:hypothetical protein
MIVNKFILFTQITYDNKTLISYFPERKKKKCIYVCRLLGKVNQMFLNVVTCNVTKRYFYKKRI